MHYLSVRDIYVLSSAFPRFRKALPLEGL